MRDLITLALTSHALGENIVRKAVWKDIKIHAASGDPDALLKWAKKNLSPTDAEQVAERLALISDAEAYTIELSQIGITTITEFSDTYPTRYIEKLKGAHPAVLFVAGNLQLLREPLIGIVGSRDVDDEGSAFAENLASEGAKIGYGVVSGGARGVDKISMRAAYEAGAPSVGILADSLQRTAKSADTQEALESGRVCLMTPFSPTAGFSVGNAMGRNKLIYALSDATVIVAATEGSGGTWAGAIEALEKQLCPVFVRPESEGSSALIAKGAVSLPAPSQLGPTIESATPTQGTLL